MKTLRTAVLLAASLSIVPSIRAESAAAANRALGSGVNLGNALEAAHREGEWGVTLQPEFFPLIRKAGFDHVRVPVRWSAHAAKDAPYAIDETFFRRVDWVLDNAASNGLRVVLNMHHYDELDADPASQRERYLALWDQIARRYAKRPATVLFEPLNEPHNKFTPDVWNDVQSNVVATIRRSNPARTIVVTPVQWSSIDKLKDLRLPDDPHLVVTVHYYQPFHFTHQGANWAGPDSVNWLGAKWTGSSQEVAAVRADFDKAAAWSKENGRPVYLGEFGAYEKADMESRARWTRFVRQTARERGLSTAYWEFCAGFGIYDRDTKSWREPLLQALTGK